MESVELTQDVLVRGARRGGVLFLRPIRLSHELQGVSSRTSDEVGHGHRRRGIDLSIILIVRLVDGFGDSTVSRVGSPECFLLFGFSLRKKLKDEDLPRESKANAIVDSPSRDLERSAKAEKGQDDRMAEATSENAAKQWMESLGGLHLTSDLPRWKTCSPWQTTTVRTMEGFYDAVNANVVESRRRK